MTVRQKIFARLYRGAQTPESLPWHREGAPALLRAAVERRGAGRALDVGCGAGVHTVYLAQQGFSVVGVDFVADALELTRARARAAGVSIDLCRSDVLDYDPPTGFDVVLDSGCLHHVPSGKVDVYRDRLTLASPRGRLHTRSFLEAAPARLATGRPQTRQARRYNALVFFLAP